MKRLLAVYSTAGISKVNGMIMDGPRFPWYVNSIQSLLFQNIVDEWGDDFKVAISSCQNSDGIQQGLQQTFGDNLSYNYIEDNLPLSITFNDTVNKCVKQFGEFEGYLYIDSGVTFWDPSKRYDAVKMLYEVFKSGPYAITAAMPSNDDGSSWWNIQYQHNQDYIFPMGKTTNMHCQIFSEEWRQVYKNILPDIFASNCMESIFTNMAAAIKKKFILTQKVHALHLHSLDGASIGQREEDQNKSPMSKQFPSPGFLYRTQKDMDAKFVEGYHYGMGFEECAEYWRHDPDKFDVDGYAKDERLKEFWAREAYLKPEEFDYSTIKAMWTPGR